MKAPVNFATLVEWLSVRPVIRFTDTRGTRRRRYLKVDGDVLYFRSPCGRVSVMPFGSDGLAAESQLLDTRVWFMPYGFAVQQLDTGRFAGVAEYVTDFQEVDVDSIVVVKP